MLLQIALLWFGFLVCLQLLSRWASVEVSVCLLRLTYVSSFHDFEVFLPAISRSVQNRQTRTKIEYQTSTTRKVYRHHYARYPVLVRTSTWYNMVVEESKGVRSNECIPIFRVW